MLETTKADIYAGLRKNNMRNCISWVYLSIPMQLYWLRAWRHLLC